jgi:hypothetical protein
VCLTRIDQQLTHGRVRLIVYRPATHVLRRRTEQNHAIMGKHSSAAAVKAGLFSCAWGIAVTHALPYQPPARGHARVTIPWRQDTVDYPVSLWPWPQQITFGASNVPLGANFQFVADAPINSSSLVADILADNFLRYSNIIFQNTASPRYGHQPMQMPSVQYMSSAQADTTVLQLMVTVASSDDTLQLGTSENYNLSIAVDGTAALHCSTVYGCIRGLETFSQLVVAASDGNQYVTGVPIDIQDFPRFPHRGLLIDTRYAALCIDVRHMGSTQCLLQSALPSRQHYFANDRRVVL